MPGMHLAPMLSCSDAEGPDVAGSYIRHSLFAELLGVFDDYTTGAVNVRCYRARRVKCRSEMNKQSTYQVSFCLGNIGVVSTKTTNVDFESALVVAFDLM